jgi:hypothetical protein
MAFRRRLKNNKPPEGWELIEEVIDDFELQVCEPIWEASPKETPRNTPGASHFLTAW